MKIHHLIALFVMLSVGSTGAQSPSPGRAAEEGTPVADEARARNIARVDALYQEHAAHYEGDEDAFVRRGLLANRRNATVYISAEAAGVPPQEPLEFLLISEKSGHDYEALAISFARPSDVNEALRFIGLPPGAPFDPKAFRYLPKGERVAMEVSWVDVEGTKHEWPAEELIYDYRTKAPLVREGFVFSGSDWITNDAGERVYLPDTTDPQSIVSIYNERITVLDVPRDVPQGFVYGSLHPHPDRQPPIGQYLEIRLTPIRALDQPPYVADLLLRAELAGETDEGLRFRLSEGDTDLLRDGREMHNVLAALNRLTEQGREPYLKTDLDDRLSLREVHDLFALLASFEKEDLLRIEPPTPGTLFYRAFLPDEALRDRALRPSQALELRLTRDGDALTGRVVEIVDQRARREGDPDWAETEHVVSAPDALPGVLAEIDHPLAVLLVFAPDTLSLGELMAWLRPVLATHPIIHIYLIGPV